MASTCVVGLQWGDEAKGKLVDLLTDDHDIVVRYQGGANAGHTVVSGGKTFKFSLIPTGILHPRCVSVIGNGLVIDPARLIEELEMLRSAGVAVNSNLLVSDRAHVIFPYHKKEEEFSERAAGKNAIGTTMRGIGPCYRDKVGRRYAIRMGELLDPDHLRERLEEVVAFKNLTLRSLQSDFEGFDAGALFDQYRPLIERIAPFITDTTSYLHEAMDSRKRLLFEGAQGALLDVDHGTFPFVTSSNSSSCGLSAGCGVPAKYVDRYLGVVKAYTTRVGGGPFPTELQDETGERIRRVGREFGTVTGRPRRCGWFDAVAVRYSAKLCGVDSLAVMLLDVLTGLDEVSLCVAYRRQGQESRRFPADWRVLQESEPVFETMAGWKQDISTARIPDDLPDQARAYIKRISEVIGLPVGFVSVGPDRNQTVRFGA